MSFLKYCTDCMDGKMFRKNMTKNKPWMFREDQILVRGHNFLLKMCKNIIKGQMSSLIINF